MTKHVEYWFDLASPYSYLASTQLSKISERTGATFQWRPFLVRAVFKATGNLGPLSVEAKILYSAKDLEDWRKHYGIPFQLPTPFPVNSVQALRLALIAEEQGRLEAFCRAAFETAFAQGEDLSDVQVLKSVLTKVGMDADAAVARSEAQEIKDLLRARTDELLSRGGFGAPTFFVGDEMFVGNDRLMFVEAALRR
jgi:2-hydroxychromene-2-carboxylate isomerase